MFKNTEDRFVSRVFAVCTAAAVRLADGSGIAYHPIKLSSVVACRVPTGTAHRNLAS